MATFIQNVLANWFSTASAAAVVFMVGLVMVWLRSYWPTIAWPILYGVVGSTCVAAVLILLNIYWALPKPIPSQVGADTLESTIRGWLDAFHLGVRKVDNDAAHFSLLVTTTAGKTVTV